MNLQQVRKITRKWQKDLGLTNWKIKVEWGYYSDMDESDGKVYGFNEYDPNHMTSTIKIMKNIMDGDVEETIVHELMHLFMFPLESAAGFSIKSPTDQWETAMEQTLNKLSELLVNGNRREEVDCDGG